ncbi:Eco29kI family restriction endonuclease [Streptomyces sp. NPDC059999]|uniref:Eco29kI family restriction endonuclease n=1 Tax=Streptomyces sp. NPDC059999 TaxID=3347030 RepID=UPI0036B33D62
MRIDLVSGELAPWPGTTLTMVFQKDVDRSLVGDERYALAITLRLLAQRLGVSLTRYSARVHWDRSTLSRYFSGTLVPPAGFVDQLVADGDRNLNTTLALEATTTVHRLHREALRATSPAAADLQDLRDQLAEADRQSDLLQQEAGLLREMIADAGNRIKEQEAKLRLIERSSAADRITARAEIAQWADDYDSLRSERDRLQELISRLEQKLAEAEQRASEAEARCAALEGRLETAEEEAAGGADEEEEHQPTKQPMPPSFEEPHRDAPTVSLGITHHTGTRLLDMLTERLALNLTKTNISKVRSLPGIFMLFRRSELMYVGKADRSLPTRLATTRRKLEGRLGLDPEDFSFTYLYIEDDMTAVAPEQLIIKQLRGSIPWNANGFGNSDPGSNRDQATIKASHFDALHPINLNLPIRVTREPHETLTAESREIMELDTFARKVKKELPYTLRLPMDSVKLGGTSIIVPQGPLSADQAFRIIARGLGESWQISALLGYVVVRKENDIYPSATRYYRGTEIVDVPPVLHSR